MSSIEIEKSKSLVPGAMVQSWNPSNQEGRAKRSWVQDQPGIQRKNFFIKKDTNKKRQAQARYYKINKIRIN